jgi:hypothetical protein
MSALANTTFGGQQDRQHPRRAECIALPLLRRREGEEWMIRAFIVGVVLFLVLTFPATFLLMLFLGNLGKHLSYWGTFPLGILVSVLIGSAGSQR